jgi:hypothetical protein
VVESHCQIVEDQAAMLHLGNINGCFFIEFWQPNFRTFD